MGDTAIGWTHKVWNPTTGCDRVSPGCDNSDGEAASGIAADVVPLDEPTRSTVAVEQSEGRPAAALTRDLRVRFARPPKVVAAAVCSVVLPPGRFLTSRWRTTPRCRARTQDDPAVGAGSSRGVVWVGSPTSQRWTAPAWIEPGYAVRECRSRCTPWTTAGAGPTMDVRYRGCGGREVPTATRRSEP